MLSQQPQVTHLRYRHCWRLWRRLRILSTHLHHILDKFEIIESRKFEIVTRQRQFAEFNLQQLRRPCRRFRQGIICNSVGPLLLFRPSIGDHDWDLRNPHAVRRHQTTMASDADASLIYENRHRPAELVETADERVDLFVGGNSRILRICEEVLDGPSLDLVCWPCTSARLKD